MYANITKTTYNQLIISMTRNTHINMTEHIITVPIYCKQVYTCNTRIYNVPLSTKINDLIKFINDKAVSDFNLNDIEIVDNQPIYNGIPEESSNILIDEDTKLITKYSSTYKNGLSFYIRKKITNECIICYNTFYRNSSNPYNCQHYLCMNCANNCRNNGIASCPYCRNTILSN